MKVLDKWRKRSYIRGMMNRDHAAHAAIGLLEAMLHFDEIPAHHRSAAQRLVDAWHARKPLDQMRLELERRCSAPSTTQPE